MNLRTRDLKSFIIGSLLGDGSLTKAKNKQNSSYREGHSSKQKEYLLWKKNILEKNLDIVMRYNEYPHKIYKSITCRIESNAHSYFTKLYKLFYPNHKKQLPFKFIEKYFNELSLAILIMDDGYVNWRNKTISEITLCVSNFSDEEVLFLNQLLYSKFDLIGKISKQKNKYPIIRFYGNSARKVIQLISPYVSKIECMKYKIDFKFLSDNKL